MRKRLWLFGALIGGLTSLPLIAVSYLGEQWAGLPYLPFDLFDWLARTLPGDVITLATGSMVRMINALDLGSTSDAAKSMEQLMGVGLVIIGAALLGVAIAWADEHSTRPGWQVGAFAGGVASLFFVLIEFQLGFGGNAPAKLAWLGTLIIGWGAGVGRLVGLPTLSLASGEHQPERRAALVKIAGASAGVALGAWGLGRLLESQTRATGAGQPLAASPPATPEPTAMVQTTATPPPTTAPVTSPTPGASPTPLPAATATATMRDRVEAAPGTRPELTPNDDFYRIDINTRPVIIDGASWVLRVDGLFDNPRPLTLQDILAYPPVTQAITLSCISNRIGGDLIGTSNWTGVRLRDVLKDLGLRSEAEELFIEGADGFFESVAMEDLMDPRTLLVYGMNGETLSAEHGFPLRIYIPNRYGMKQPKWITRIEAIDGEGPGYWVQRGWSAEARPQIVSVIDTVAKDHAVNGSVPIGGIAWAGDRGIQKVELQVDGGEWVEAILRTPPLSGLTWVQWRYDWPAQPGRHTLRVRATDGTGALQIEAKSQPAPNGATGYHSVTVVI